MPILLFGLRNVPTDEAEEVRMLLTQHEIIYYETSAGNWGVSMPAIWLPDATQQPLAQELLEDYQRQRYLTQRELYLEKLRNRETPTFVGNFLKRPFRFIAYTLSAMLIAYLSTRLITEFEQQLKQSAKTHQSPQTP